MRVIIYVFILLSIALSAEARDAELVVEKYPPFFNNELAGGGMIPEIIDSAFKAANSDFKVKIIHKPYARAIRELKKGLYPMHSGASSHEMSSEDMKFIKVYTPINVRWIFVSYNKSVPKELKTLTIGTYIDSFEAKLLREQGYKVDEKPNLDSQLKSLYSGRVDLISLVDLAFYSKVKELYPNEINKFKEKTYLLIGGDIYISLKHPQGKEIDEVFEKGFKIIKKDGTLLKIVEKYYGKGKVPKEIIEIK